MNYLDRPPRNRTARSGADDSASIDDGVSTCSNLSDVTSTYDDSEGKYIFKIIRTLLIIFQPVFLQQMILLFHRIILMKNLIYQLKIFEIKSKSFIFNFIYLFIYLFSLKTRENSLRTLQTLFSQKYLSDLVSNRYINLTEQLITSLRKGNESEGKLAAIVTSLFLIQLGESDDELFIKFRDAILPTLRDETKSPSIRKNVRIDPSSNQYILLF